MTSQRICIHQFHYSTAAGDAVTNQMLFIREALREVGVSGEIFARENKAPESYGIKPFAPAALWNADLILIHHSHGNPVLPLILQVEIPKALIYHNVTPSRFFAHDPYIARLCDLGRRQLRSFRDSLVAAFAVSRYNARELAEHGIVEPRVFPLLDLKARADRPVPRRKVPAPPLELLFVGKLAPHKNQALLVEMLFYLHRNFPNKYRLVLVGRQDPIYGRYLRGLIQALRLDRQVQLAGSVDGATLQAHYDRAAAFVSASRHEGFGIPLVEAMQNGLPVFALPGSGVRETLGNAGVRFETRLPHRLAEIVDTVLSKPVWVQRIVKGQTERLASLQEIHNKARVQELLLGIVHELRHPRLARDEKPLPTAEARP